ncbi:MAG: hypothetical protein ACFE0Q_20270 [Anaerolineae bacterium]
MSHIIMPTRDRHWRVYQLSITTDVRKGAATKYITEYMEAIGFVQTQLNPTLIFERGNTLASLYNMNPKSQKTIASMDFASIDGQTVIELTMRVNCLGNQPLSKDFEFWALELAGIEDVLNHGYVNPTLSDLASERALWYNVSIALMLVIVTIALTITGLAGALFLLA